MRRGMAKRATLTNLGADPPREINPLGEEGRRGYPVPQTLDGSFPAVSKPIEEKLPRYSSVLFQNFLY